MSWSCPQTEEHLSDFLDGLLGEDARREFSAHAKGCVSCATLVEQVSSLVRRVRALEPVEEPPRLVSQILDRTLGPRAQKADWRAWISILWRPRFAMGLATVAICLLVVFQAIGVRPSEVRTADLNPVNLMRSANRRAHLAYARGVKFITDLRVVYEIQSRLQPLSAPPPVPEEQANPPRTAPPGKSLPNSRPDSSAKPGFPLEAMILTRSSGGSLE